MIGDSRENYFPHDTHIEEINDTLYTDYGWLSKELPNSECEMYREDQEDVEPPF